jgi:DNA (cytosine-5)-methyltransferase 1
LTNGTLIDFFCGAGGFSEGFRQLGFQPVLGVDYWQPAVDTYSYNFETNAIKFDVGRYYTNIHQINLLPDTDVILGSPPCVAFSSSNKSGKGDKSSGVFLTESFLRIVAVKKWQKDSILKAWFMENVANSTNYLQDYYTFKDLNLTDWAIRNGYSPIKKAVVLKDSQFLINSANYGSPQARKRVVSGEITSLHRLLKPPITHSNDATLLNSCRRLTELHDVKEALPSPFCKESYRYVYDPNYNIRIKLNHLTDHFYDTGLHESVWRQSRFLKTNHPYMGKMSFPENEHRPARTVTATKIGSSREAHIYKSEHNRKGDGEYRTPTIREMACLMGFPVTYQFLGSEGTKCRLIGNAVCPSVSRAFASTIIDSYCDLSSPEVEVVKLNFNIERVNNLNTFRIKSFGPPPKRNKNSRFRRHMFKTGNITVSLSNYSISKNQKKISNWQTSIQYGNGEGFPTYDIPNYFYRFMKKYIKELVNPEEVRAILKEFNIGIVTGNILQILYERQFSSDKFLEPTLLLEKLMSRLESINLKKSSFKQGPGTMFFPEKMEIPSIQVLSLYILNYLATKANNNPNDNETSSKLLREAETKNSSRINDLVVQE